MHQTANDNQKMNQTFSHPAICFSRMTLAIAFAFLACFVFPQNLISQEAAPVPEVKQPEKKDAEKQQPAPLKEMGPQLPPDSDIPGAIPAIMTMDKPMVTEEELKALKKYKLKASPILLNGTRSSKDKIVIEKWVDLYILPMTLKKNLRKLPTLRRSLKTALANGGRKIRNKTRATSFRRFLLETVAKRCETLFDNNFHVRLNAVLIINDLKITEANSSGESAVAFAGGYTSLLKVIRDPKQHEAVKIVATQGLKTILMDKRARTSGNIKQEIAKLLISELGNPSNSEWYDRRLVRVLARVDMPNWLGPKGLPRPFILLTLLDIMKNNKQDWQLRAEAARGLGLTALEPGNKEMDPKMIASEVVRFCDEMSKEYNKTQKLLNIMRDRKKTAESRKKAAIELGLTPPLKKENEDKKKYDTRMTTFCTNHVDNYPKNAFWKNTFFKTFLAFKPRNRAGAARKDGLLLKVNKDPQVTQAYQLVLPVIRHVINQPDEGKQLPVPDKDAQKLTEWLKNSTGNVVLPTTAIPTNKSTTVSTITQ